MNGRMTIDEVLAMGPVLPVVTIPAPQDAADLARALAAGGFRAVEVTLRTPAALAAIESIARQVPEVTVGAGTVLSVEDLRLAASAGAEFAVSPGATPTLLAAGGDKTLPYLPGAATASEIQAGFEAGHRSFKFFPAAGPGGLAALRAFAGPFAQLRFCATGGITLDNAQSFLDLPNVICVGGSWFATPELVLKRDWNSIESQGRDTLARLVRRTPR